MFLDEVITRNGSQDVTTREYIYTYEHPWLGKLEVAIADIMFQEYPIDQVFAMVDGIATETFRWRLDAVITVTAI